MRPVVSPLIQGESTGDDRTIPSVTDTIRNNSDGPFGDLRPVHKEKHLRVGFWNCGGFSPTINSTKDKNIHSILKQHKFDIFGFSECNLHWPKANIDLRLKPRTRGWFETLTISSAFLTPWEPESIFQPGGESIWCINKAAHRVEQKGSDPSNMGRWAWITLRGQEGKIIRFISAYRCNKSTGPITVWTQQRIELDKKRNLTDPREQCIIDLRQAVEKWSNDGDLIILGIDLNEDIRKSKFTEQLQELGIVEINIHRHENLPPTYHRGSAPIDGLYVSRILLNSPSGYLPIANDHRIMWIDIPTSLIFGCQGLPPNKCKARRLQLLDPRIVHRYNKILTEHIISKNLLNRAIHLQDNSPSMPILAIQHAYNEIDHERTISMKFAESKCRKLTMGEIPFSPQYTILIQTARFWSLVLRRKQQRIGDSKFFKKQLLFMKLSSAYVQALTIPEVIVRRSTAYSAVKLFTVSADQARMTHLQELGNARAIANDTTAERELKEMAVREKQRQEARTIKYAFPNPTSFGLHMLQVTTNENTSEITDRNEMENLLCSELAIRFHQSSNTPFAQPPLLSLVGKLGDGPGATEILNGTFQCPTETDYWTTQLIPHLMFIPSHSQVRKMYNETITTEEHIHGWKKMKESTSPGFSSLSFAQFKASATNPSSAALDTIMANIPYQHGISPERWQKGLDIMLQKQQGNYHVEKLRAILLFETDFNQNNKRFGRQWMYLAEKFDAIAVEQFGSRKNLSSIDQSLNKTLTFDLFRQSKQPGAICSNDAKSCYDRILHNVASICLQRIGVPTGHIKSMFSTIQNLQHHVRTIHGESESFFSGGQWEIPIHGVGQGNGAGPQIWAAVSTPIFNMLRSMGFGAHFISAITRHTVNFVGYAFVDDTDLVTFDSTCASPDEVFLAIQSSLTAWEGGITATGGAIVPSKSHWYMIDFDWKHGKAVYKNKSQVSFNLQVLDSDRKLTTIKQLEPWEAERTLGVRLAPDGNMNAQLKYMVGLALEWCEKIRNSKLPRHLVSQALFTTITKSLQYALPSTTLTKRQCDQIMRPFRKYILPKMGIMQKFPADMVYATGKFFGLSFPHIYWLQGIDHMDRIIRYATSQHLTGRLIRLSAERFRLEMGCNGSIFQLPYLSLHKLATDSWIKSTWEFLSTYNITLNIHVKELALYRKNDQLLIPALLVKKIGLEELTKINRCRLYLQVNCISDITTMCGKYISTTILNGQKRSDRLQTYEWPVQQNPPADCWTAWRTGLKTLCSTGNTLHQALGVWTDISTLRYHLDPSSDRVYSFQKNKIFFLSRYPGRASRSAISRYHNPTRTSAIPPHMIPISTTYQKSILKITGTGIYHPPILEPFPSTFEQFLNQRTPDTAKWAIQDLQLQGNITRLHQSVHPIILYGVSDGSYKNDCGTASWIIKCDHPPFQITGSMIVPGQSTDQSPYRSELAGLYGLTIITAVLHNYIGNIESHTLGCDGLTALNMIQSHDDFISPNLSHFDLIFGIRSLLQQFPFPIRYLHIKGHQDSINPSHLDKWALLNIAMDTQAKMYWQTNYSPDLNVQHRIFGEPASLWLGTRKITCNFRSQLLEYIGEPAALQYWESRLQWAPRTTSHVDWQAIGTARKSLPKTRQIWISKHATGIFSSGDMMVRWKFKTDAPCPRCNSPTESASHIIRCPNATAIWNKGITSLYNWMIGTSTKPSIAKAIQDSLNNWRRDPTALDPVPSPTDITAAMHSQNQIGWHSFLNGFISKQWQGIQADYLLSIQSKVSIKRWTVSLILKLWNISWDMWEHRNEALHHTQTGALRQELDRLILLELAQPSHHLPKSVRKALSAPTNNILNLNIAAKQLWLRRITTARQVLADKAIHGSIAYTQERSHMAKWLRWLQE